MIEVKRLSHLDNIPSRRDVWICVENCMDTQRVCLETLSYCLDQGGKYAALSRIRALIDAAAICQTTVEDSRLGAMIYIETCELCSRRLERCVRELLPLSGDRLLEKCINTCRRCIDTCNVMLNDHQIAA